jgi:hypothetical protein
MILPLLTSLLLLAGAEAAPDPSDPRIATRGEVVLQSVGADEIMVVVDSSVNRAVDGWADYLFVYKAKGLGASAPRHFPDATVEYEPGLLRITVEGRNQRGKASWEWSTKTPGSRSLAAYWDLGAVGMADTQRLRALADDENPATRITAPTPNDPDPGCDAGGKGATACSVGGCFGEPSSCSISGQNACCYCRANRGGAKCVST